MAVVLNKNHNNKWYSVAFNGRSFALALALAFTCFLSATALAADQSAEINDILENTVTSSSKLPALLSGLAYMLGLIFTSMGVIKLKDHVENPSQTALKASAIRFAVGGMMFALPIVYEAMKISLDPGTSAFDQTNTGVDNVLEASAFTTNNSGVTSFNDILKSIVLTSNTIPVFVAAVSYAAGLLIGVLGVLKLKEHVENPDQMPIRTPVIRLLVAGALFALPIVYGAMQTALDGGTTAKLVGMDAADTVSGATGYGAATSNGFNLIFGNVIYSIKNVPLFISVVSYVLGLLFGALGIIKLREHVESPDQNPLRTPVIRFIAAGALFALPMIYQTARNAISGTFGAGFTLDSVTLTIGSVSGSTDVNGIVGNIMSGSDSAPLFVIGFSYVAGLLMIGLGILKLKEHVENPSQVPVRTPVIRFLVGGALLSLPTIYSVIATMIDGGASYFGMTDTLNSMSQTIENTATVNTSDTIMGSITVTTNSIPLLVRGIAYLIGLILGISGLFKLKEHVENPDQVHIKEPAIRLIVGGALFALPSVYEAMRTAIDPSTATYSQANSAIASIRTDSLATFNFGDILQSITDTNSLIPLFITAVAYTFGVIIGFAGVMKLKDHVQNPDQTPIKAPVIRFLVAGMMFALPIVFASMEVAISSGSTAMTDGFDLSGTASTASEASDLGTGVNGGLNFMLKNMGLSINNVPLFIAWVAFALGGLLGVLAILKMKEHVENPDQTPLRTPVIRFLIAGAMFALPVIYQALQNMILGNGSALDFDANSITDSNSFVIGSTADTSADNVNKILSNLVSGVNDAPLFLIGLAYTLGLIVGAMGLLKLKEHVENPSQTPMRTAVIRLIIAGALLAMPTVFNVMATMIDGGGGTSLKMSTLVSSISGEMGSTGSTGGSGSGTTTTATNDVNTVVTNLNSSTNAIPLFIRTVAYLIGLILGFAGLLKVKEHVENPEQVQIREGVIRLVIGGALFALPAIFDAMYLLTGKSDGFVTGIVDAVTSTTSGHGGDCPTGTTTGTTTTETTGSAICGIIGHTSYVPAFMMAISYTLGLALGVWGLLKIRDHVLNPSQTHLWDGVSRIVAGSAFFSLPLLINVAKNTLYATSIGGNYNDGFRETSISCTNNLTGLDGALYCMMSDMFAPMHVILNFFAFLAGIALIMIGISRLLKSAQEGARGPAGLGTVMTFLTGGALISYNDLARAMAQTLSFGTITKTYANLNYTTGMSDDELAHAHTVISAVLKFLIIVGLISFVRGIFIIRGVAEGNSQSSLMAGVTHIVGGALAVNLGPLMNAVQATLGITGYGITFGT